MYVRARHHRRAVVVCSNTVIAACSWENRVCRIDRSSSSVDAYRGRQEERKRGI